MVLHIEKQTINDVTVLKLHGRLTLSESQTLGSTLKQMIDGGHKRVVLDVGNLTNIDSSGLAQMLSSYISARRQGSEIKLLNPTKKLRDLLELSRLITVFESYDSLQAVLSSFSKT